ncbi:hypothetical protein [Mesorhizobium waimense]|nr:hypothetical protein [Mesorhizobium waimense]
MADDLSQKLELARAIWKRKFLTRFLLREQQAVRKFLRRFANGKS